MNEIKIEKVVDNFYTVIKIISINIDIYIIFKIIGTMSGLRKT